MARITISKRIGHTSKVSEQASFLIEDKAAKACKVLGLKEGILPSILVFYPYAVGQSCVTHFSFC